MSKSNLVFLRGILLFGGIFILLWAYAIPHFFPQLVEPIWPRTILGLSCFAILLLDFLSKNFKKYLFNCVFTIGLTLGFWTHITAYLNFLSKDSLLLLLVVHLCVLELIPTLQYFYFYIVFFSSALFLYLPIYFYQNLLSIDLALSFALYVLCHFTIFLMKFIAFKTAENQNRLLARQQELLTTNSKWVSIGHLCGELAHEINTPLCTIAINTSDLLQKAQDNKLPAAEAIEPLSIIAHTVDRVHALTQSLKTLAHSGRKTERQILNLFSSLKKMRSILELKLISLNIDFNIVNKTENDSIFLQVNETELIHSLLILCENAIDALEQQNEKWIEIRIKRPNHDRVLIQVCDCGKGLDKEAREKIFNTMFTSKPVGKGSGVGLTLAQKLVNKNEGKIYLLESFSPTIFEMEFPIEQQVSKRMPFFSKENLLRIMG